MLAFVRRNQVLLSSFLCVLFSLYILAAASRGYLRRDPVGPILLMLMRPLQMGAQATIVWARDFQKHLAIFSSVSSENQRLKARIHELEAERHHLLEAEATNRRLRELLDLRSQLPARAIGAAVIANSASTWFQTLILDKGSADGVLKEMAVVSPAGVVGQVVAVTQHSAKVLLATDPHSGVDAIVQRSRARGIVSGSPESGPVMKYVKRSEDIQEGDRLITSGLDGVFPKGLLVGTVVGVRKKTFGLFQHVTVSLAVNPARLEEVLVVSGEPVPRKE